MAPAPVEASNTYSQCMQGHDASKRTHDTCRIMIYAGTRKRQHRQKRTQQRFPQLQRRWRQRTIGRPVESELGYMVPVLNITIKFNLRSLLDRGGARISRSRAGGGEAPAPLAPPCQGRSWAAPRSRALHGPIIKSFGSFCYSVCYLV